MESKEEFLEFAISKFLRYGSKRFTLDDLSHEIGISKKTIYQHFTNKEALVYESLGFLLDKIKAEVSQSVEHVRSNPLLRIIMIYKIGLEYLKLFSPTFLEGIKKYYPKVNEQYHNFKNREINGLVLSLLKTAQKNGQIRQNVNVELSCQLYLNHLESLLFQSNNLFDQYSNRELLENLIINYIRGIATDSHLVMELS